MGVKGLFTYIQIENVPGTIINFSIKQLSEEIKRHESKFKENPKILINIYAFNNYYEQYFSDIIFGGRFNKIKQDFESFLSVLKSCGADLYFTSKMTAYSQSNSTYTAGMAFVAKIEEIKRVNELTKYFQNARYYPWNELTIIALAQSAQKFGVFCENGCSMLSFAAGDVKLANEQKFFAIIGLNTSYLLYEGTWRYFYPTHETNEFGQLNMAFNEYDKQKILNHFDLNYEQMKLLAMLGGEFFSTKEYIETLDNYFSIATRRGTRTDFKKIMDFIHEYAPKQNFPISKDKASIMLKEIFGFVNDDLLTSFILSNASKPVHLTNTEQTHDDDEKEIDDILRKSPFTVISERLFFNDRTIYIYSHFLDVEKTDFKSLKDLTLPWIKRICGLLLKTTDNKRKINYRVDAEDWEAIEIEAEYPDFEIPTLKQRLQDKMCIEDKFKVFSFLIDGIIDEKDIKKIPQEFLMHAIILMHLVKNDSMKPFEAVALAKTLRDVIPKILIYPLKVDTRAFRVSALYHKMYEVLLNGFYIGGLMEFAADITLDNVVFQNNYNDMKNMSTPKDDVFDAILSILKA